jgi:hypothetical protein
MNNSGDPTFFTVNGQSHIDLTLTNINSDRVNNWKVLDIETNSEHCYISFVISNQLNNKSINDNIVNNNSEVNMPENLVLKQNNKKFNINYQQIRRFTIDQIVQILTEDIIEVCDENMPLKYK